MGFLEEHYEKLALGVGGLTLVGAAYLALSSVTATEQTVQKYNGSGRVGEVKKLIDSERLAGVDDIVAETLQDLVEAQNSPPILSSIPLLVKRESPTKAFDPLDLNAENIHENVPNSMWAKWGLEKDMIHEGALDQDPDEDGFTTREEATAGTNPNDASDYPELLSKLEVKSVNVNELELKIYEAGSNGVYFKIVSNQAGKRSELCNEKLVVGQKGPQKSGNKALEGLVERFLLKRLFQENGDVAVELIDLQRRKEVITVKRYKPYVLLDRTATLFLNALGKEDNVETFSEGDRFTLPFSGKKGQYSFESIKPVEGDGESYSLLFKDTKSGETKSLRWKSSEE